MQNSRCKKTLLKTPGSTKLRVGVIWWIHQICVVNFGPHEYIGVSSIKEKVGVVCLLGARIDLPAEAQGRLMSSKHDVSTSIYGTHFRRLFEPICLITL